MTRRCCVCDEREPLERDEICAHCRESYWRMGLTESRAVMAWASNRARSFERKRARKAGR